MSIINKYFSRTVGAGFLIVACEVSAHGDQNFLYVQTEQLEYRAAHGANGFSWDVRGWAGGDIRRLWFKTQGDDFIDGTLGRGEVQARYSRMITPFWDAMAGVRYDFTPSPTRGYAVLALHGMAPYFYEVDADLFVSPEGEVAARLEVEAPILITQRLILQPSFELNFSANDIPKLGVATGLSDVELGVRLRYEIVREVAPYLGFVWERKVGRASDFTRALQGPTDALSFVAGFRLWF